ncbi:MAG: hypothetical protein NTW20_05265 [Rhodobacterales bacterium]|nr:hypothetical protein [Rhodobacterales bacterium]
MSRARDIEKLEQLSRLMLDDRLSRLRAAMALVEKSRMQIAALDRSAGREDLPPVAASQVALRYQLWADVRKSELNAVLARQTVTWLDARHEARQAFGRAEALRGIADRLIRKK